ncbi:hypothetical protein TrispH2_009125 [Trichoplax sp. H2]|nr:hypothetical protein TrispH2_009125 [Trichoplax sp. H2]|eukprot:RDD39573.1 hypothetical protein TrispH2_009125 [Trichoplax sp. H2]
MASILRDNIAAMCLAWSCGLTGLICNILVILRASKQVADLRYRFKANEISYNNGNFTIVLNSSEIFVTWQRSPFCYIARFLTFTAVSATSMITNIMALDRLFSIVYLHLSTLYFTSKRLIPALMIVWIISAAIGTVGNIVPYITFPSQIAVVHHYHNLCTADNMSYISVKLMLLALITGGSINYIVVIGSYVLIFYKIKYSRGIRLKTKLKKINKQAGKKVRYTAAIITCANAIFWFPCLAVIFMIVVDDSVMMETRMNIALDVILPILSLGLQLNCAINPIIFPISTISAKTK